MYIVCVVFCSVSAMSRRVGAFQMSVIIVTCLCFIIVILYAVLQVLVLYQRNLLSIIMRLLAYDMLVNVNGIYYAQVREQARWAHSAGNSATEHLCIIIVVVVVGNDV